MLENRSRSTRVRNVGRRSRIVVPAVAALLALVAGVGPARSAFAGTNGLIAFTSDINGDGAQLYVINATGGAPTQLTTFGNPVENPAWSPDGTRIAFSRSGDLLVIDPDSLDVTPVTDPSNSVEAFEPAWSPDGTMLAFSRRSGADTGIWRINVDGTGLVRLTDRDDRDPAWSLDGGSIAFTRWALGFGEVGSSPGQDIYVMNPDGSGQLRLTGRNNASDPTWSPDGSEIAYVSREPEPDIYVLSPNDFGSVLRQVTFDSAYEFGPSWSPDGTRIVFERGRADGSRNDIFGADADGSGHETQLSSGHGDRSPDWQSLSAPAPAQPTCSIGSTRVAEGDAGTTDATFEVDCTNPTALATSVDYATAPGTAHATADYTAKTGTLSVAPGDSHLQIRVRAVGDTAPEPHETFTVTLASSDVVIDRPTATATITDDDGFTVRVETLSVTEGNAGFQDVDLGVTLSHAADQPVTADLVIRSVAALFGVDYDLLTAAGVVFDPGDVREVVTFRIYGDADVEGDQKIEILPIAQLVTDANSLDGGIWIRDDDLASLTIDDVTVPEGASPGIVTFTVTRSNVADDVTVHYGAFDFVDEGGTARAGEDYEANEGLISFAPGSPTATIEISIIGDALDEPAETFGVRLSEPFNATITDDAGVGTITDDDDPPTVSIGDSSVTEGDSGTTTMAFKVDLSAPSGQTTTVDYATADGTASSPEDYAPASGTVTFAPGETSHQVVVGVIGEQLDEFDDSFTINLSGPSNLAIADGAAVGTILNDDTPPAISINSVDVIEGDSGITHAIFTVSLPAPSGKTVRVAYATADGTATAVADYMPDASDVVFAPGETAKELPIDVVGDVVIESNEAFTVNLSGATNASILDATGTATIQEDDEPLVPIPHRLASGFGHTCAVTTAGGVRCWGSAGHGALGRGNTNGPLTAAPVVGLSSGVVAVTSGLTHSCALTASGGVKCWGSNEEGQHGDGTTDDHFAPIDVPSLTSGVVDVAAGGDFTCALTSTGGVKCWGSNNAGQLGDGTDVRRLTPVDVTGLSGGAVAIAAGWFHACALMGDGSIRCWGADVAGQLGDGTFGVHGVRLTPVRVLGLPGPMTAVTAGLFHTCGLTSAGRALCWGDNDNGQLGDGTTDDSLAPVGVLTMSSGVAEISAGQVATCARTAGGAAKCWGDNELGQLGNDGSPVDSASPVQVTGLASGVTAISAGGTIGCALTTSVAAKCWGAGGNVGDGVVEQRNSPVFIPGYGLVLSIDDLPVSEGQSGTPTAFTVTLGEPSVNDVTVDYATSDGSATAGSDYTAASGTLRIPAGDTSRRIPVTLRDDTTFEPTETFNVVLSNASNAAIARGVGTATVFDDDVAVPELSIDDVTVTEGDSGGTPATFTVTLSMPSSTPVNVDFATSGFDALAGPDYDSLSGKLTFDPFDTSATITVNVVGDPVVEADETFQMLLGNAVGATIADDTGTATIVNDDVYADVSILVTADHDATTNPVGAGRRLVDTLAVTNHGPGPAADIRITDAVPHTSIPNDAAFCLVVAPATACDTTAGSPYGDATAIPTISALGSGESITYQIGYTVDRGAPSGAMGNTAAITTYSSDANPSNDSSTVAVRVDALPVASFTFGPSAPVVGGTVSFDSSGSTDDAPIAGFAWAFGDGATGTGSATTHAYATAGTFTATLTVTDAIGGTSTATRTVMVSNVAPPQPPSAHRVLRGTVTRVVPFAPGGDPAGGRVPLAGAVVTIGTARLGGPTATTDALGHYVFTNLTTCTTCDVVIALPGSTNPVIDATVTLGGDPSVTVRDFVVGTARDQLYVTGLALPPVVRPGDPQPPAPLTVGVRVYAGNISNPNNLVADSAKMFPGPGGFGAYQLLVGQIGRVPPQIGPGTELRVVLVENGVNVPSTQVTFRVPQPSGTLAPLVVTVPDLVAPPQPPSAHRVLRGTVTRVVPFAPGGDPAGGRVPLAGAVVTIGTARLGGPTATTDALGHYVFTNLTTCTTCDVVIALPGSTNPVIDATVTLGGDPSVTVRDFVVGTARDQLYVTGLALPPVVRPGDPQPPAPLTVGVRVYAGNISNPNNLVADSAKMFPGPGGFGAYQLLVGQIGRVPPQIGPGTELRVVLVENGVNVPSTQVTFRVPQPSGTLAPLVVTVPDLVAPPQPPSAHRVLRGTVTRVVPFAPGGDPAGGRVPLAGAVVTIGTARLGGPTATTDALGHYVFTNLTTCTTCDVVIALPGSTNPVIDATVTLGGDPSVTVRDFVVGTARDQLYVTGLALPPVVRPGDPQPPAPLTVGVRVYAGNISNPNNLVADSAKMFPGPGGFGAYQLLVGQIGRVPPQIGPGTELRVVLVENGVNVPSTQVTFRVPQPSGTLAPLVVTVPDLVGQ